MALQQSIPKKESLRYTFISKKRYNKIKTKVGDEWDLTK